MKIRVKFSKQGNLRFVGHLDIMRYFQKANRRAEIPVKYSEGFSPHQIMSFAAPLGMGLESLAEYFDLRLTDESEGSVTSDGLMEALNREMADGIRVESIGRLPDDAGNCMAIVHAADYRIRFLSGLSEGTAEALRRSVDSVNASDHILIKKKTKKGVEKEIDIRPLIRSLRAEEDGIFMRVSQGSENNLKPSAVWDALLKTEGSEAFSSLRTRTVRCELYDAEMKTLEEYGSRIA